MHELLAAASMMNHKYDVYFPIGNVQTDFVAIGPDGVRRCQVKTAYWADTGGYKYICTRTGAKQYGPTAFDDLIVVGPDKQVWRIPWGLAYRFQTLYFNANKKSKKYDPDSWRIDK